MLQGWETFILYEPPLTGKATLIFYTYVRLPLKDLLTFSDGEMQLTRLEVVETDVTASSMR